MFPTLEFECPNGHVWGIAIPKYWVHTNMPCAECGKDATGMRAGKNMSLSELQAGIGKTIGIGV